MKKQLKPSILSFYFGTVFLILAFAFPSINISVGFAGGRFGPVIMMLYKYLCRRKRPEEYDEKAKNENTELYDERREMTRGKTLRVSTLMNWGILSIFIVTISLLSRFEIVVKGTLRYIVLEVAAYWLISAVITQIIYKWLNKKY